MNSLNPSLVLDTLIKHETLTIHDLSKEENLGIPCTPEEVEPLLHKLKDHGFVTALANVHPPTYTITDKGIKEGRKWKEEAKV